MNSIAIVWVAICVILFCLPTTPAGVFGGSGLSWSSVNYAPIATIGLMLVVTIWYVGWAKKT